MAQQVRTKLFQGLDAPQDVISTHMRLPEKSQINTSHKLNILGEIKNEQITYI